MHFPYGYSESDLAKGKVFPFFIVHKIDARYAIRKDVEDSHGYEFPVHSIELMIRSIVCWEVWWRRRSIRDRFILKAMS